MGLGYMGYSKFFLSGPSSDARLILCTGSSVNMVLEPIMSSAVWGAGWYNAATVTHYADSVLRYNGGIDFELQVGNNNEIWNFYRDWAINWRAYPRSLQISPDGNRVYNYFTSGAYSEGVGGDLANFTSQNGGFVESMSFSTSSGSAVTASITMSAIYRNEAVGVGDIYINQRAGVTTPDELNSIVPLNLGQTNVNPIPFWKTNAQVLATSNETWEPGAGTSAIQTGLQTVDWSIDLSNNPTILYTCSGNRNPTAIMMGAIDSSANVTLFHPEGVFDPSTGRTAENTCFRINIDIDGTNSVYLEQPAVLISSDDYGIKGQSDPTTRAFSLTALGGRIADAMGSAVTGDIIYPPLVMYSSEELV